MAKPCKVVHGETFMEEILSRLPPKSLMRFKCVRKSWNSIINHPSFVVPPALDNQSSSTSTCPFQALCLYRLVAGHQHPQGQNTIFTT